MEEPTRIEQKKKEWRDNNQLATLRKEALIYTHIEEIGNVINDILIYKIELENLETVLKEMLFLVGEGNCIIFSREELGKEALTSFVQDCFAVTNRIISLDLEQMHYWGEETGNKLIRIYNKNGEDLETAFVD